MIKNIKKLTEDEKGISEIIEFSLDDNLIRFLRKLGKIWPYELTYSKKIPILKKTKEGKRILKYINKKVHYPRQVAEVIKIFAILHQKMDYKFSKDTAKEAYKIWDVLGDIIDKHMNNRYQRRMAALGTKGLQLPTKKQAWKEQLAQGFIHVNDFEDYNREASHITSNIDDNYIYPENFGAGSYKPKKGKRPTNVYIAQRLIGVQGWTRAEVPSLY